MTSVMAKSLGAVVGISCLALSVGTAHAEQGDCACLLAGGGETPRASLENVVGTVFVSSEAGYAKASDGTILAGAGRVFSGPDSSAVLSFSSGCAVSLSENARISASETENGGLCVTAQNVVTPVISTSNSDPSLIATSGPVSDEEFLDDDDDGILGPPVGSLGMGAGAIDGIGMALIGLGGVAAVVGLGGSSKSP